LLYALLATARSSLRLQRELALENLALRQQLAIVQRKTKRPKLSKADRAFWVVLCGLWPDWQHALLFPNDSAPRYVIRDRDKIYGADFVRRVRALGIEQVLTAPQSPWQNSYCERVIGTLRRDCLNHVIVVGEQHLRCIPRKYLEYYHRSRTHLALDKDAPELRQRESADGGKVIALPMVGGLHHRYARRAWM
jgi:hypothetical protein